MNCPKCAGELNKKFYKAMIEVDFCPNCRGMWLDFNELDRLEDMAFEEDERKGSLIHFQTKTNFPCPHCNEPLQEFQYRLYNLKLEHCATHNHGFWLDAGEDERVIQSMQKRAQETKRKINAETEWKRVLKDMHSFLTKK
jgi:Zn-finger nucleic acid-binding protein